MAMQRIWNITDGPNSTVKPQTMLVLGKILRPGRAVQVEMSRLEDAKKIQAEVAAGRLYIGHQPPEDYQAMKKPPRAVADARLVDANGKAQGSPIKPSSGHGFIESLVDSVVEGVKEAILPSEESTPEPGDLPDDDSSSWRKRKKK